MDSAAINVMTKFLSLTDRLIKGSSTVILFTIFTSILNYTLRILYSRVLSIEEYGLYFAFISLFSALALYTDLGFGYSISYLIPKFTKKGDFLKSWDIYKYAQLLGVIASLIIALILIAFAPWIAREYFKVEQAKILIYIFSIYLFAGSFVNNLYSLFIGLQQEKYYSAIQTVRVIFTISFSIFVLLFAKPNVVNLAIVATISYIICAILFDYIFHKNNKSFKYLTLNWDKKLFKKMYSYGVPTLLASSVYSLIITSDTFFLTLFRGVRDVGIYNIILPLASIPLIFISPISNFFLPLVSHLMEKEQEKISLLMQYILKFVPFVALYFSLFIATFPSATLTIIFGSKWVGLAEIPLSILALGFVGASLSIFFTIIVMGIGKAKERLSAI